MSMKLEPEEIIRIGNKALELEKLEGVEIKQIEVAGHDVYLNRIDGHLVIVGISNKVKTNQTGGAIR